MILFLLEDMGICLGRGLCQCKGFLQTAYPRYATEDGQASIPGVPADWGIREQGEEVKVGMEFDRGT